MSRSYLSQLFNKELGCSFSDYVNHFRVEESKRLLEAEPLASIQEIAERSASILSVRSVVRLLSRRGLFLPNTGETGTS